MNTKLLKQKILDLAIRGKLVPQDPNDEPASELLKRIRAEKEKLIAEGKIKRSKKLGKRNFIIIVSEGCGHEFGPSFTERIERETGVESRFARLAHVVRGGTPTLEDRLLSSQMGVYAVEQLLEGKSNIVICARDGKIVSTEIRYALALDRMYKNKLNPGDLDPFTEEQIAEMRAFCDRKRQDLLSLYAKVDLLGL